MTLICPCRVECNLQVPQSSFRTMLFQKKIVICLFKRHAQKKSLATEGGAGNGETHGYSYDFLSIYIFYSKRFFFYLRSIHVGERAFHRGYHSYVFLNESVMVSKKPWLEEVLRSGQMEVLIYNGNLVRWTKHI